MKRKIAERFHHPLWARYLLTACMTTEEREETEGDLEEGYGLSIKEVGPKHARMLYTLQVVATVWSRLLQKVDRSKLLRWLIVLFVMSVAAKLGLLPLASLLKHVTGVMPN